MHDTSARYSRLRDEVHRHNQSHLLAFWDHLSESQRDELLADIEQIDFKRCAALIEPYVRNRPEFAFPAQLEPVRALPASPQPTTTVDYSAARARGEQAIRAGEVAAFTVAGGQGTRLGFDGPKGAFEITPIRRAPLFQVFAESLLGCRRRYGRQPHWYIMTSPANHRETLAFFESHAHFGLGRDAVTFFPQRQMPAFLPDGRIAMSSRSRVALSPDGHGGSLHALAASGALAGMTARGERYVSYFQVDNPLVRCIDPLFIGLHIETGSEMSSKAVAKSHDLERVGNFCRADGRVCVIEYSDLPEELARSRNVDGSRRFDAGSIAIHILSREFIERLTAEGSATQLPWHRADKKQAVIDEQGHLLTPAAPNVVKLEMFVFDAIPLAANPLVLMTERSDEFSPVKNADGADSPFTTRRDLVRRAAQWLQACGARIPRRADGEPDANLEIAPSFALDADDLRSQLPRTPDVAPGSELLLC